MYSAVALSEDGTALASHCCSHEGYMKHDLGLTSDWKHEHYNAHHGVGGWVLEWVEDIGSHEGLRGALRLNQLARLANEKKD